MKRGKELLANTVIIAIGNFSTKIISFFLLPLYTSLLSATDYGIYDLLITISTFTIPFVTLLIEESMFRFLIDCKNDREKKKIITHAVTYVLCSMFVFILIYLVISLFINIPYKYIFLMYICSQIIVILKNAITRGMSKIKLYAFSNFITSFIIIILNIIFIVYLNLGISSLLISYIISNLIISIFVLSKLEIHKYISFDLLNKKTFKEMIKYSLPLVPNSISWTVINLSDRVVISSYLGTAANGIYSIAYKFPSLLDTIYSFFYTAWKEMAAKSLNDDDSELFYNRVYVTVKNFMWSVVIGMIAIFPFVFNILIKKEFLSAYLYVPILLLAMYFSNISGYFGGIFSANKDTKIMGGTTIYGAIINLVINFLLIQYIGIWAAALSTLASTFSIYIYRRVKVKKYVNLANNIKIEFSNIAILILSIISYYSTITLFQLLVFFIVVIYCIFLNREIIHYVLNKAKRRIR